MTGLKKNIIRDEINQKILQLAREVFVDVEPHKITLESRIYEDLGAEELDNYDLITLGACRT